jgi:hypothetical protein
MPLSTKGTENATDSKMALLEITLVHLNGLVLTRKDYIDVCCRYSENSFNEYSQRGISQNYIAI